MNNDKIIPFGKYKGQPIEVLQQDKQYLDWLQTQDWVKQRYGQFNTVIINNFQEPSESPDHNKLCNLFLDESTCQNLVNLYIANNTIEKSYMARVVAEPIKDGNNMKPFIPNSNSQSNIKIPSLKDLNIIYDDTQPIKKPEIKIELGEKFHIYKLTKALFEQQGVDVSFSYYCELKTYQFKIEVKPNLGDDYPAILRQMDSNEAKFLIADNFTATGATLEQVKEIFKRSGKFVHLFSEFL